MFGPLIRKAAEEHDLSPELLASVIHVESRGEPNAVRYEHAFFEKYLANKLPKRIPGYWPVPIPTASTEKRLRAFSFGLCQIMLQTARELGFKGKWGTELLDPKTNLYWGAKKLAQCMERAGDDVRQALLFWNGGGDKTYPDRVLECQRNGSYVHLFKFKDVDDE